MTDADFDRSVHSAQCAHSRTYAYSEKRGERKKRKGTVRRRRGEYYTIRITVPLYKTRGLILNRRING